MPGTREQNGRRESVVSLNSIRRMSAASINSIKNLVLGRRSSKVTRDDVIDSFLVDTVRSDVLAMVDKDPSKVDLRDAAMVKMDTNLIERFIRDKMDADAKADRDDVISGSVANLLTWLEWRKNMGVPDLRGGSLFREAWDCGLLHIFVSKDSGKCHVIYLQVKKWKKVTAEALDTSVKMFLTAIEILISKGKPGQELMIVLDTSGIGFSNADVSLATSLAPIFLTNYPGIIKRVVLLEAGLVVKAALAIVSKALPAHKRNRIFYLDCKAIVAELGEGALPRHLGGSGVDLVMVGHFRPKGPIVDIYEWAEQRNCNNDSMRKLAKVLIESQKD
ncbi:hypothetical protein HDE_09231 [Halotydeus destructor]|nr:hypothetical protein HDE_09231 [Halotydeus destructor]